MLKYEMKKLILLVLGKLLLKLKDKKKTEEEEEEEFEYVNRH